MFKRGDYVRYKGERAIVLSIVEDKFLIQMYGCMHDSRYIVSEEDLTENFIYDEKEDDAIFEFGDEVESKVDFLGIEIGDRGMVIEDDDCPFVLFWSNKHREQKVVALCQSDLKPILVVSERNGEKKILPYIENTTIDEHGNFWYNIRKIDLDVDFIEKI